MGSRSHSRSPPSTSLSATAARMWHSGSRLVSAASASGGAAASLASMWACAFAGAALLTGLPHHRQNSGCTFPGALPAHCQLKAELNVLKVAPVAEVTRRDLLLRILPMALVTNMNVCLGNVSLRYIPVSFMQTVKAFTPAATVFLQRVFWGKTFDTRIYVSLLPVVGGVALTSATELSFHMGGFLAAVVSTLFTALNSILAEVLLKGKVSIDSLNTVYYMAPQIALMVTPVALMTEWEGVLRWYATSEQPTAALWAVVLSGVFAFGLNFSLFFAIQATSAMTFNIAGNLKVAVAIFLGCAIFRNPMSVLSVVGCIITVAGCTWYGVIQQLVMAEANAAARTAVDLHWEPTSPSFESAPLVRLGSGRSNSDIPPRIRTLP
eukprot:SM000095S24970  [mRNA]  locus=s95:259012:260455:+ [translate_table: standard]